MLPDSAKRQQREIEREARYNAALTETRVWIYADVNELTVCVTPTLPSMNHLFFCHQKPREEPHTSVTALRRCISVI